MNFRSCLLFVIFFSGFVYWSCSNNSFNTHEVKYYQDGILWSDFDSTGYSFTAWKEFKKGWTSYLNEDFNQAIRHGLKAYAVDTNHLILNLIALSHCHLNHFQTAEYYYLKAMKFDSNQIDAYMNYSKCLNREGRYDKAISILEKASKIMHSVNADTRNDSMNRCSLFGNFARSYEGLNQIKAAYSAHQIAKSYSMDTILISYSENNMKRIKETYPDSIPD